jgi:hypothetical protein
MATIPPLLASASAALASVLLAGCAPSTDGAAGAGTSPTPTVTVTVTVTPPTRPMTPSSSTTGKPPASPTPGAGQDRTIPTGPQAYTQDFVTAWVQRDRGRAQLLGTTDAVAEAFAHRLPTAPTFARCEGTAGSSYCTYDGKGFTVIVRVLNDASSHAQAHAVIEVRYSS